MLTASYSPAATVPHIHRKSFQRGGGLVVSLPWIPQERVEIEACSKKFQKVDAVNKDVENLEFSRMTDAVCRVLCLEELFKRNRLFCSDVPLL
jgi:hypothetical protein